ncbi:MAG: ATP-grasp domain-containing protein, partial [Victivallales bacterium]|nr:ATP-grasp domain-containing protein [Victivallales bacterium]
MIYKTIIIANIAEAFEDVLRRVKPEKEKTRKIQIEHNLCDRTLLWEGDDKIVITPFPISSLLFGNNMKALGFKNCLNLFPSKIDISLSDAIIRDKALLKKISDIIEDNPGIRISPYAITPPIIDLTEIFKNKSLKFVVEERPYKNSDWTMQFLDSKIGSRLEIDKIKDKNINTPRSIVCRNKREATAVVKWFYNKGLSCVAKANFGEGGWGTLMVKINEYKSWNKVLSDVTKEFDRDCIWDDGLILVEEYIETKKGISSGCPSSELFLSDKGPKITYLCDQIVTEAGNFLGITLGKGALSKNIEDKIKKSSIFVGRRFWELGYRGFFDIDFVLSEKDGTPYIIETNTRRTGGTHIFDVARSVFGKGWKNRTFILSQDSFSYGRKILSEEAIFKKLESILFPIDNKKRGVIISIINKWKPTLGFI